MLQSLPLLSLLLTLYEGFNIDPFCSLSRHHPGQPMQRLSAAEDGVFFCRKGGHWRFANDIIALGFHNLITAASEMRDTVEQDRDASCMSSDTVFEATGRALASDCRGKLTVT